MPRKPLSNDSETTTLCIRIPKDYLELLDQNLGPKNDRSAIIRESIYNYVQPHVKVKIGDQEYKLTGVEARKLMKDIMRQL